MAIFQIPAAATSSVPNWTLLSTNTPSGVSTITFSGLSGYSKYRIMAPNLVLTGGAYVYLRCNGDVGTNYSFNRKSFVNPVGSNVLAAQNQVNFNYAVVSSFGPLVIDIDNALLLAPKKITANFGEITGYAVNDIDAQYQTTSLLTSLTLLLSASAYSTGSIYLFGAN